VVDDVSTETASPVAIESLRDALRGAVHTEEVAALIESMLLDALRATKDIYTTCPSCKHRHPVPLPDRYRSIAPAALARGREPGAWQRSGCDESGRRRRLGSERLAWAAWQTTTSTMVTAAGTPK